MPQRLVTAVRRARTFRRDARSTMYLSSQRPSSLSSSRSCAARRTVRRGGIVKHAVPILVRSASDSALEGLAYLLRENIPPWLDVIECGDVMLMLTMFPRISRTPRPRAGARDR